MVGKIPGKLRIEDLDRLIELVAGRNILQIGCYCGRGLVAIAEHAQRIWVLEDFKYPGGGIEGVVEELRVNVNRWVPEETEVNLLYGTPENWTVPFGSLDLEPDAVDVVYRDANRSNRARAEDERLALDVLRLRGGVYAWHDEFCRLKWLCVKPVPVEVN